MGAVLDPLRNTLDQLALDPRAREDRRYLASVLRRLGYSETEIAAALGYETDGPRVIEVEYQPPGQKPRQGDFTVVADWQGEDEVAFSVARDEDPARSYGWMPVDDAAVTHGWLVPGEEGLVEFTERGAEPWSDEAQAWPAEPEAAWQLDEASQEAPAAWPDTDLPSQESAQPAWEQAPADEEAWTDGEEWAEPQPWQEEAPAVPEPVEAQPSLEWPEPAETQESAMPKEWAAPAEQPWTEAEQAWAETEPEWAEPQEPEWAASEWSEADAVWDAEEPQASPDYAITAPPGDSWAPSDEPFTYDGYTLHTRMVELSTGRQQRIYFFARNEPKSGEPSPLPPGYIVETNERTGLPFLRRDPDAEVPEAWNEEAPEAPEAQADTACLAVTKAGTRCRNASREGSKYCTTHKGWRGPRAA